MTYFRKSDNLIALVTGIPHPSTHQFYPNSRHEWGPFHGAWVVYSCFRWWEYSSYK